MGQNLERSQAVTSHEDYKVNYNRQMVRQERGRTNEQKHKKIYKRKGGQYQHQSNKQNKKNDDSVKEAPAYCRSFLDSLYN